jgi:hypothetical protein
MPVNETRIRPKKLTSVVFSAATVDNLDGLLDNLELQTRHEGDAL